MRPNGTRLIIAYMSERRGDSEGKARVYSSSGRVHPKANVVVLGGDAVVGTTSELLLGSAGYRVGFVPESSSSGPGMLETADLPVPGPGLTAKQRPGVLAGLFVGGRSVARTPVVELVPDLREGAGDPLRVPRPCRAEDLRGRARTVLVGVPGAASDEER